jgi:hypothetical protein
MLVADVGEFVDIERMCRPPRPVPDRQMWGILYPPFWWGIITATETFGMKSSPHTLKYVWEFI